MRGFTNDISSKWDSIDQNPHTNVLGVIDDISLMLIDRNFENLIHEINNHRVGLLQMLILEQLYRKEAEKKGFNCWYYQSYGD